MVPKIRDPGPHQVFYENGDPGSPIWGSLFLYDTGAGRVDTAPGLFLYDTGADTVDTAKILMTV